MKLLLPIMILAASGLAAYGLYKLQPEAPKTEVIRPIAQVEVLSVSPTEHTVIIESQGTLLPNTEIELSAETTGRILYVSPAFKAGAYIEKGEVLIRIDPSDYETTIATRSAELANARMTLSQEKALAEQAVLDWESIGKGEPSELTLRKPQLIQAEALVESAQALYEQAKRTLEQTEVKAPFRGQVLETFVDLGQHITATPATPVARIFATGIGEVRLPITGEDADLLEITPENPTKITLSRIQSGKATTHQIIGQLARLEATVDPQSRLLYAVARVDSILYHPANNEKHPGFRRGLFLNAQIEGKTLDPVFVIPRSALRDSSTVYILFNENQIKRQKVNVIHSNKEQVVINEGLKPNDRIVTSPVAYFVENMEVEIIAP